ncbi:MAG: class I SAM-dependent methyltransferase [Halanaerobiales bacterium]|nr:class I SAM-dependent methyltransferase [Halanaerobiales bacterium]
MHCRVCKDQDLRVLDLDQKYYYCKECEAIFIDRKEIIKQEEEKERYEGHDNTHQNEGYVKMFEDFLKESVFPFIEDVDEVLEFGCGPGPVLADLLKREDYQVDKYDPYFYPERVYENKKYDLITSTEVFEHFSEPRKEMEFLTFHLKAGGYLAIMTSFHPGPEEFADWWYKWDPTHIVFYNLNTFQKLAEDFNLKIIYTDEEKYIIFKKE